MVQNRIKAGRPSEFELDKVLEDTMNLFWERGYNAVGISDLEKQTKLNRSSLYNSFGSKVNIFTQSLEYYTSNVATEMMSELKVNKNGLSDLKVFTDKFISYLTANPGRGCFMVNTMAATSDMQPDISELVEKYIMSFLETITEVLSCSASKEEIKALNIKHYSELYLGAVLSANLLSRSNQSTKLISGVLYSALDSIGANRE